MLRVWQAVKIRELEGKIFKGRGENVHVGFERWEWDFVRVRWWPCVERKRKGRRVISMRRVSEEEWVGEV